ncbi:MAG TPA: redoxin domain-containing protein [Candidatus Acidoferrales bacterium]|nr:redoxin domain-containing protein [Candidatus Acidoferrales bacterium]
MSGACKPVENDRGLDWLTLVIGPLVLLLLLALGVEARPGEERKPRPAPSLPESGWLNTPENKSLRLKDLRGKVVLVEFWTYGCYNCRNQLPFVKKWQETYAPQELVVIGVHTPEFEHESRPEKVKKAVEELGITFPVVLDNDYATWNRYQTRAWPTVYLVDHTGHIVYRAEGEGDYERTEARIQALLREAAASAR